MFKEREQIIMPIVPTLDTLMNEEAVSLKKLSKLTGISVVNLSNIKTGKIKAMRFSTLNELCRVLQCRPGDILDYVTDSPCCKHDSN